MRFVISGGRWPIRNPYLGRLRVRSIGPPLCPSGHLPHKGGDRLDERLEYRSEVKTSSMGASMRRRAGETTDRPGIRQADGHCSSASPAGTRIGAPAGHGKPGFDPALAFKQRAAIARLRVAAFFGIGCPTRSGSFLLLFAGESRSIARARGFAGTHPVFAMRCNSLPSPNPRKGRLHPHRLAKSQGVGGKARRASSRSPSSWGRCPAGQRGAT